MSRTLLKHWWRTLEQGTKPWNVQRIWLWTFHSGRGNLGCCQSLLFHKFWQWLVSSYLNDYRVIWEDGKEMHSFKSPSRTGPRPVHWRIKQMYKGHHFQRSSQIWSSRETTSAWRAMPSSSLDWWPDLGLSPWIKDLLSDHSQRVKASANVSIGASVCASGSATAHAPVSARSNHVHVLVC